METYNHKEIEPKWQKYWEKNKTFKVSINSKKEKFYALDMFPYPSGAGLHVGHPLGYTATDIISRKKRHEGRNVLHPMGWDAFGLPAENYAIKTGVHPAKSTAENIATFSRQIKSLGFSYDWSREIDTTDPNYFRWSQWIFLQLYKHGLAYEEEKAMNWCPKCRVVCANEEVEQGTHERCGEKVEKKKLKQWMLKITDYAERLLQDLDAPTVCIIHGWGADKDSNWFPWLKKELEKKGCTVLAETFSNTENPNYKEWETKFSREILPKLNSSSIVIGHSLGCGFVQKFCTENDVKFGEIIFTAPTTDDCGIPEIANFFTQKFDYEKIKNSAHKITIYGSENDEYIPLNKFENLAKNLAAEFVLLKNREHLCELEAPEVLAHISKNILDWPEKIKSMQRHWIGRSEGAEVDFEIAENKEGKHEKSREKFFNQIQGECVMLTFNTISKKDDDDSSIEIKVEDLIKNKIEFSGEKLVNTDVKADIILNAFREAESNSQNEFNILEAVVTENHVHMIISVKTKSDEVDWRENLAKILKKIKGVSSRRFWQNLAYSCSFNVNSGIHSAKGINSLINTDNKSEFIDKQNCNHLYLKDTFSLINQKNYDVNGGIHSAKGINSLINTDNKFQFINKQNCNHLWRKGTHVSFLLNNQELEKAYNYILQHAKKEKFARFLSDLPQKITVFTTRPDTLFGATYFVLSPEHPLVDKITTSEFREKIKNYKQKCAAKSDLERTELNKEKTGQFTGGFVINPVNGKKLPVWIADYVLTSYGTGAIMAVPAHDERDYEFAKKYDLDVIPVVNGIENMSDKTGTMINSEFLNGLKVADAITKMIEFLEKKGVGKKKVNYKLRDWIFTRQRYWGEPIPLIHCEKDGVVPYDPEFAKYLETNKLDNKINVNDDFVVSQAPFCHKKKGASSFRKTERGCTYVTTANTPLSKKNILETKDKVKFFLQNFRKIFDLKIGKIEFDGQKIYQHFRQKNRREFFQRLRISQYLPEILNEINFYQKNNFYLGYFRLNNQIIRVVIQDQKIKTFYISHKLNKTWQNLAKKYQLPLKLPETPNYQPSETGESPLAKITDWVNCKCPICGQKAQRETSTMPNWAGSSWYWLRFMDSKNSREFCSSQAEKYWGPVDLYVGGAEHAVLHLLYARFWHKFLYDLGLVSTREPFKKLVNQGLILAENGVKMSKSLGNVVNPDEVVEKFGADTLRCYEMFMGPFEQSKAWSMGSVGGVRKFLERIYRIAQKELINEKIDDKTNKILHQTIKIVGNHIDEFKFNTAISQLMILVNELTSQEKISREIVEILAILISPFAPHLAEEIWHNILKNKKTIAYAPWPKFRENFLVEDEVTYAVQVNGKVRGDFQISKTAARNEVLEQAKKLENVAKYLENKEIKKEIFVPNKIVGFVV